MHSIFEPRIATDKDGKIVPYIAPSQKEFDKYYIKRVVRFVPVPINDGGEDYVLEMKVSEDKEDIDLLINSQAPDVGLQAMLEKYQKTGDPSVLPSPVVARDDVVDYTKLPQDSAEYFEYIHALNAKYQSLPIELRKDLSAEEFVKQVTDAQVDAWLKSIKPQEKVEKKEGNKDE